jgi:predicted nucleic acid-binding protein
MTGDARPRLALDTNVLVYAEGLAPLQRDAYKPALARTLLEALPAAQVVVPIQALGELFRVLVGKGGRSRADARAAVMAWRDTYPTSATAESTMLAAMDLAADHGLSIWDAIILAAAADRGCRLLLSEDMQDGFTWRGLTVADPFAAACHPLLAAMLADTADRR